MYLKARLAVKHETKNLFCRLTIIENVTEKENEKRFTNLQHVLRLPS
jgi:hypothetical protein